MPARENGGKRRARLRVMSISYVAFVVSGQVVAHHISRYLRQQPKLVGAKGGSFAGGEKVDGQAQTYTPIVTQESCHFR